MITENNKSCAVVGSGVAGLGAAIRMRNRGYKVTIFESNSFPGGKMSSETNKGYRFDYGPSVFTLPMIVDDLFVISGKNPRDYFNYSHLDPVFRFFFEDGTVLDSPHGRKAYAKYMASKTSDSEETILKFLERTETIYNLTGELFMMNSLHKAKNYFKKSVAKGIFNFGKIGAFDTMHSANEKAFTDKKLIQMFDRYATYNGSSPYVVPATLNVIPYVEIDLGAFYPEGGMHSITTSLVKLAEEIGITIKLSTPVKEIVVENKKATGIKSKDGLEKFDIVISNADVYNTYQHLMPEAKKPKKVLSQPKSSSGIVFYWGIKKEFKELEIHNLFYGSNYFEEFDAIVNKQTIYEDPTVYINITSKLTPTDAPAGCENWFTFVNVPYNSGQDWDKLVNEMRENIIKKLNRILKTDIRPLIECEMVMDPRVIEQRTSSAFGAIYGNASNSMFAAFFRHPNFSKDIKNLYFCGGSVHPGPGIPMCLLSTQIATGLIED